MSTEPQDKPQPMTTRERRGVAHGDRHMARVALQRAEAAAGEPRLDQARVGAHLEIARGYLQLSAQEWPELAERADGDY